MNATETIWPAAYAWAEYDHGRDTDRLRRAFAQLTAEEARDLAERATQVLETAHSEQQYDDGAQARMASGELLIRLVCHVPNVLEGLYDRLIDARVLTPESSWSGNTPLVFCDAGPTVRDRLIAQVDDEGPGNWRALAALAWIGDEVVCRAMVRWVDTGPLSASPWLDAGWDLMSDGSRRDLYQTSCYRLERGDGPSPVRAGGGSREHCGGCGDSMITALDLDLAAPLLGGEAGQRLTISTCGSCVFAGTVHVAVGLEGQSTWLEVSDRARHAQPLPFAPGLRLGEERPRPFTALAFGPWETGTSQLGGFPLWVQHWDFPECPNCDNPLPFAGQLGMSDFDHEFPEGIVYVFYSPECGQAATLHQQT